LKFKKKAVLLHTKQAQRGRTSIAVVTFDRIARRG